MFGVLGEVCKIHLGNEEPNSSWRLSWKFSISRKLFIDKIGEIRDRIPLENCLHFPTFAVLVFVWPYACFQFSSFSHWVIIFPIFAREKFSSVISNLPLSSLRVWWKSSLPSLKLVCLRVSEKCMKKWVTGWSINRGHKDYRWSLLWDSRREHESWFCYWPNFGSKCLKLSPNLNRSSFSNSPTQQRVIISRLLTWLDLVAMVSSRKLRG